MDIKIKIVEKNGICYSNGDNCVIEIPDEELMHLGKRYFELTLNDDKNENENHYYLTNDDAMVCARKLKVFCQDHNNCKICPFVKENTGSLYGCKIGCRTGTKVYTPDNWEV